MISKIWATPLIQGTAVKPFGTLTEKVGELATGKKEPINPLICSYSDFLKASMWERKEILIEIFNHELAFKKRAISPIKTIISGFGKQARIEKLFSQLMKAELTAPVSLVLYEDHLHFLVNQEDYKKHFSEGNGGQLLDEKRLKEEARSYLGIVSIGCKENDEYLLTANHERYHGLTHFFPAYEHMDRLDDEFKKRKAENDPKMKTVLPNLLQAIIYDEMKTWHSCLKETQQIPDQMMDIDIKLTNLALRSLYPENYRKNYSIIVDEEGRGILMPKKYLLENGAEKLRELEGKIAKEKTQLALEMCTYSEFPGRLEEALASV